MRALLYYHELKFLSDKYIYVSAEWIGKKIRDLMGEEEPSFCEFVFEQLISHKSPSEVIDNLNEVLDEDTEAFVLKLFGVVIFETERIMNDG